MNRRQWLINAVASLVASTTCAAFGWAVEPLSSAPSYRIGDAGAIASGPVNRFAGARPASHHATSYHATSHHAASHHAASSADALGASAAHNAGYDAGDTCDACCDDWIGCGNGQWFVEAEGLLWWRKSRAMPPLVTTSIPNTPQEDAGVLGLGSTRLLFGGENVSDDGPRAGGRISFGRFLDRDQEWGVAASFFALEREEIGFTADSSVGILAIPFFNAGLVAPAEGSLLVNFPNVSQNGRVNVHNQNDVLGADVYLRKLLWAEENFRVDAIGGYQFSRIDDDLTINANFDDVSGIPNENFDITDVFRARNEFHGGSVGVLAYVDHGRWTLKGIAKCGLGNMRQTIDISGQTITTINGVSAGSNNGLFALPTNIGTYTNDEFGIIPEAKLNIGYRVTEHWTFSVGYSFMYWNNLATGASALDRNVNLTQVPGPPGAGTALVPLAPNFANNADFWVQGINFSAEFLY
jgi:hypothetical protein